MPKLRKQLSIALTGKRMIQVAYLYAILSVLRDKDIRKIVRVIDFSMEVASKALRETYRDILISKKSDIIKIMNERFNISSEEAEKYVKEQLNLDIKEILEREKI
ncbi:MAG: hypothetical protein QXW13_00145 [Nanopusillaceae archaeon]